MDKYPRLVAVPETGRKEFDDLTVSEAEYFSIEHRTNGAGRCEYRHVIRTKWTPEPLQ